MNRLFYALPLSLSLGLLGQWRRSPLVAFFTVVVVALAVALIVSADMAARSVDRELTRTAQALAGEADFEVSGGRTRLPERLLDEVRAIPGVSVASPLLETTFRIAEGERKGDPLHVIGLDLLADFRAHAISVEQHRVEVRDAARLVNVPGGIVVTPDLLQRLGVAPGAKFRVRGPSGDVTLTVQGTLHGQVAEAYAGLLAVTDLYALQTLVGAEGWIDRIAVVLAAGADREAMEGVLQARVSGVATVQPAGIASGWTGRAFEVLRASLNVILAVGFTIAALIAYATISRNADARLTDFAVMRSAGVSARTVFAVVVVEAALLGALGAALGLVLGIWLAPIALEGLSSSLAAFELLQLRFTKATLDTALIAAGTGMGASVSGSILPALRAAQRHPLEVLVQARPSSAAGNALSLATWLLPIALAALFLLPVVPLFRLVLLILALVALIGLVTRRFVGPALLALRPFLERSLVRIGSLAGASLLARPAQTSLAITSLASVLGLVGGLSVVLASVAESITVFTFDRYQDGIFVTAGAPRGIPSGDLILPATIQRIRETEGVQAVSEHHVSQVLYHERSIFLYALDARVIGRFGRLATVDAESSATADALARGAVAVTEAFARTFSVKAGEPISLDTPAGLKQFAVAALLRDYGPPAGGIFLDIHHFDRLWPRTGATSLGVWAEEPRETVVKSILARTTDREPFHLVYGEQFEQLVGNMIGQMTDLLWSVGLVVGGFSAIGVLNVLLGSIAQRERELALVHAAGFTRGQVVGVVLVDAFLAGLFGALLGLAGALILMFPMAWAIRETLGWHFSLAVPIGQLAALTLTMLAIATASGLYPAFQARRACAPEALAFD